MEKRRLERIAGIVFAIAVILVFILEPTESDPLLLFVSFMVAIIMIIGSYWDELK